MVTASARQPATTKLTPSESMNPRMIRRTILIVVSGVLSAATSRVSTFQIPRRGVSAYSAVR